MSHPDSWSPEQYERFKEARQRPFHELMDLVALRPGMTVVDLGCGTGELTRHLHLHLQAESTLGIDRSASMLARSEEMEVEGLSFQQGDISDFEAEAEYDLVFSNAALQWVPDHHSLLPRLVRALRPGGQLAIQVPCNDDHPTHRTAAEIAARPPFSEALDGWIRRTHILTAVEYATLLHRLGFEAQRVRMEIFPVMLPGPEEAVEWTRGSLLTAYESRLEPEVFQQLLAAYRERLLEQLPDERPLFYPFKRYLIWGRAGAR